MSDALVERNQEIRADTMITKTVDETKGRCEAQLIGVEADNNANKMIAAKELEIANTKADTIKTVGEAESAIANVMQSRRKYEYLNKKLEVIEQRQEGGTPPGHTAVAADAASSRLGQQRRPDAGCLVLLLSRTELCLPQQLPHAPVGDHDADAGPPRVGHLHCHRHRRCHAAAAAVIAAPTADGSDARPRRRRRCPL